VIGSANGANHPAKMVRELFGVAPDAWQEEALESARNGAQAEVLPKCGTRDSPPNPSSRSRQGSRIAKSEGYLAAS